MASFVILLIARTARIACSDRHTDRQTDRHTHTHTRQLPVTLSAHARRGLTKDRIKKEENNNKGENKKKKRITINDRIKIKKRITINDRIKIKRIKINDRRRELAGIWED